MMGSTEKLSYIQWPSLSALSYIIATAQCDFWIKSDATDHHPSSDYEKDEQKSERKKIKLAFLQLF